MRFAAAVLGVTPTHFFARRRSEDLHSQHVLVTEVFAPVVTSLRLVVQ